MGMMRFPLPLSHPFVDLSLRPLQGHTLHLPREYLLHRRHLL